LQNGVKVDTVISGTKAVREFRETLGRVLKTGTDRVEYVMVCRQRIQRICTLGMLGAICLCSANAIEFQDRGLSGTWIGDRVRNASAIERGVLSPADNEPITIAEDEETFTVTKRGPEGGPVTIVYRFDGTETKVEGRRWFTLAKAAREGDHVVITGKLSTGAGFETERTVARVRG
jgi:hypothetical protein